MNIGLVVSRTWGVAASAYVFILMRYLSKGMQLCHAVRTANVLGMCKECYHSFTSNSASLRHNIRKNFCESLNTLSHSSRAEQMLYFFKKLVPKARYGLYLVKHFDIGIQHTVTCQKLEVQISPNAFAKREIAICKHVSNWNRKKSTWKFWKINRKRKLHIFLYSFCHFFFSNTKIPWKLYSLYSISLIIYKIVVTATIIWTCSII